VIVTRALACCDGVSGAPEDQQQVLDSETNRQPATCVRSEQRLHQSDPSSALCARTAKSQLDTRRVFHPCDDTISSHVFCSLLALILRVELEEHRARRDWKLEWADIVHDLDHLQEIEINLDG
jgi:hypothetical protein